jgi:hypothetical protein
MNGTLAANKAIISQNRATTTITGLPDDDVDVETVRAMEWSCVDDPANEIAEFDDSADVNPDEHG